MKKIIVTVAVLSLYSFTNQAFAGSELCQENSNDCTFVLLSEKGREKVSEVLSEASSELSTSADNDKVTQASTYTETSEIMSMVNATRAKLPVSPFSTFKIPNTLIAIDTGHVTNITQKLSYDKNKYPKQAWWPSSWTKSEHTISSAFKVSMVPIYRQLATDIGEEVMQSYVDNFSYGNQDISSGLDNFWLNGSMKISAIAQVRFLQKMHKGELDVNQNDITTLKEIMLIEKTDLYSLYAKTGTGNATVNNDDSKSKLGWYVGFVENCEGTHYFALNISRDSYKSINAVRKNMVLNHLKKAGVI